MFTAQSLSLYVQCTLWIDQDTKRETCVNNLVGRAKRSNENISIVLSLKHPSSDNE